MGSISSILSSLFTNPLSQINTTPNATGAQGTSSASGSSSGGFGEAFLLSISQTANGTGGDTDNVSLEGYSCNSNGNVTVGGASGTGNNLSSAFEQLLASLEGTS